jgi:ABC-type glycerol-3-phosphate transport system substrate-binding protein
MAQQDPQRRPWWKTPNLLGVLLLAAAFCISLYNVFTVHEELFEKDVNILRITHWQLELGYRDALQAVIAEYEKLQAAKGNRVKVLQMPVTEKVYGQVLNTSLISGDAPDICLLGMSTMTDNDQYVSMSRGISCP